MGFELDYDQAIMLDAEDLAECGIGNAYESLLPELRKYVPLPAAIEERIDTDVPSYSVKCGSAEFVIFSPELDEHEGEGYSWRKAAFALFTIVNEQLGGSEYRFFAINGGNDLLGMFLKPADAEAARESLPRKQDWPYLLEDVAPWYGQFH